MSSQSRRQKFEVGDCVETSKGEKCIIRFIGKVNGLSNNTNIYGIEYIDGTIGDHNGKYKGKKYFIGLPKRCSFIKYDEIRRKTKYYTTNNRTKKSNSVKNKCKSTRSIHSNNIFTKDYIYSKSHKSNNKKQSKPKLNSKRKSLPTQLNAFNDNKKLKNRNKNTLNSTRRSSASNSNKNKQKYLLHLNDLKNNKNKQKKMRNSTTNMLNKKVNSKVKKYNNKIRTISMYNALKTNAKSKSNSESKINKSEIQSHKKQKQKRRNANPNLETNCTNQSKKKHKKKHKKHKNISIKNGTEECSKYKHERIHFSQMDLLDLMNGNGNMNLENISGHKQSIESMASIEEKEIYDENNTNSKRKNAFSKIILSQDSLNEYHLKRNLLIGDIFIGNKYLLKNGVYGVCLYVGPVHWIDYGKMSVENEYIGIALLDKGTGKHDGEFKGKRYFQCEKRSGLFVKRNKLWKDCGPVTQEEFDKITRRRKRGGWLYDEESDISDLSDDNIDNIDIRNSDSSDFNSGHSDFELDDNNNLLNIYDSIDDVENNDIVSYIDLFSPPNIDNNDIIITPKEYLNISDENDNKQSKIMHKKLKIKTKTKKKSKTRQSRSVSADQTKKSSINTLKRNKKLKANSVKNKSKKNESKSCKVLQTQKMDKFGLKNGKKWQSQTPKISKNDKIEKLKESKTKRKKKVNILENNNNNEKYSNGNNNEKLTTFPFESSMAMDESIEYKSVSTNKRSRRNATPIVSIPNLIGKESFMSFLNEINEDVKNKRNDIDDFNIHLTAKSLTPLQSQD